MCDLVWFVGYGPVRPSVVFLGIEESDGGGGAASWVVRETEFEPIEDMREAHVQKLQKAGVNPYAKSGNPVQVWNRAAEFRLALAGRPFPHDGWEGYWRTRLGRRDGDTFLMECFHVPRRGCRVAVPEDPIARWDERLAVLQAFTSTIDPRYVIAYGNQPGELVAQVFNLSIGTGLVERDQRRGVVVARVGFFGQGRFDRREIPRIAAEMMTLGPGPLPLKGS
jgi:hypothetical protein